MTDSSRTSIVCQTNSNSPKTWVEKLDPNDHFESHVSVRCQFALPPETTKSALSRRGVTDALGWRASDAANDIQKMTGCPAWR